MKILKLLNRNNLSIILISLFSFGVCAEEQPVDIWNIDNQEDKKNLSSNELLVGEKSEIKAGSELNIYNMQSQKENNLIQLEETINTDKIKIYGLFDPEDYDLEIDMWANSNGNQLKSIFSRLNKIELSEDATEIMKIALLTNAYPPKIDISEEEFLSLRSKWLIQNGDLKLIEEYLIKNQIIDLHPKLTKYLIDQYLSESSIEKACKIFSKNLEPIENDYLSKFNIYCLIKSGKQDEAQLIFDLKKELGFIDKYFEKKISYLLGYSSKIDLAISEKSILDFKTGFFDPRICKY